MDNQSSNNSRNTIQTNSIVDLNTDLLMFSIVYSLKLKDFNSLFDIQFKKASTARIALVIINHLTRYKRNIQNDFCRLYSIRPQTAAMILKLLVSHGLIAMVNCKRKTNLGLFVNLNAYQITTKGKKLNNRFDIFVNEKLKNLN